MNNFAKIFSIILLLILSFSNSSATYFYASVNTQIKINNVDTTFVNLGEVFSSFAGYYDGKIPKSYKYISLEIKGVNEGTKVYDDLQKLVYMDILPNKKYKINRYSKISAYTLYKLAEKLFSVNLVQSSQIKYLKSRKANVNDLIYLEKVLNKEEKKPNPLSGAKEEEYNEIKIRTKNNSELYKTKQAIFNDVYKTIQSEHYERDTISDIDLIEGATKGLAEGTGDIHTTYFPPTDNKDFQESLDGNFEGIGSYVEMEKPGILRIVSPIPGSPSEKAGLKGGDIILKADDKEIIDSTSLAEAISWIKGPKGTEVELTILRDGKVIKIKVIRDNIVIKSVEYKKLDSKTFYIKLLIFDSNISKEFNDALLALEKERGIKKVIFDLRNNGGGYLDQVSDMLGNFVPKGLPTAVVKYKKGDQNYYSKGYNIIDFSKYNIVLLQNGGTASASEIFIGTIKDYFPKSTIIGEQSYGKGSVQTIKSYKDGSSFKYTIAHWFTGKTQTGINGIGITPDIKLEFDFENFKKSEKDNQLDKAKSIR
ncbi:MAG: S41 family peptidase [Candidatus Gracilibacteria bacterium]|nr:S41 family peptidase [Candidatus Gracilibacteria bacterium]